MKLELLKEEKKAGRITFSLKGVDVSVANALRRSAVDEVTTLAIEDVELRKNSSALYDEMLALRLGLIPLTTDLSSYNMRESCKCEGEGCAKCTLVLTLKATGPGNVTAAQLESQDPKVKPVQPDMLIAKLLKGQKIELEAKAILGRGREHMKWSPGLTYYRYRQSVRIGAVRDAGAVANMVPAGVFEVKAGKLTVNDDKLLTVDLAGALDGVEGVTVEEDQSEIVFTVESWGQLSPRDIMVQAAKELEAQLAELDGLLA